MALTKVGSVGIATGVSLTGITTTQDAKVGTGITLSPDGHGYYTGIITATSYRGDVSNCTGVGQTNFIDAESINCSGITTVGTGITLSPDGNIYATGVVTATSYAGDGSALTGIAATANVRTGILDVAGVGTFRDNVNVADRIIHVGDTNTQIRFPTADTVTVETGGSERARIDSNGRLLINTTDTDSVSDGEVSKLIVKGTDSTASAMFVRHSADASGTGIYFGKSRNASVGSNTIVQSGDELGRITFSGDDSADINTMGAKIAAYVDGTPGANDMPGRLVFYTTTDGNSSVSERLRITAKGDVGINTSGVSYSDHIYLSIRGNSTSRGGVVHLGNSDHSVTAQLSVYDSKAWLHTGTAHNLVFGTGGANQHVTVDTSGRLLIAGTTGTAKLHIKGSGGDGIKIENSGGTNAACIDLKNTLSSYVQEYRLAVAGSDGAYATAKALFVRDQTAGANRFEIQSGGDVKIGTGDLLFGGAGKGVVLGATTNTDANTLDDYEEGSWTVGNVSALSGNATVNTAVYTKIGNTVTITLNIFSSSNDMSSGGVTLSGLPFTVKDHQGIFLGGYNNKDSSGVYINNTHIIIMGGSGSGTRHIWTNFTYIIN